MAQFNGRKLLLGAIAAIACVGVPALIATAQPPAASTDTLIHAGRLLADPATGRVLTQQSILIRNGRIVSVTAGYTAPANGAKVVDLKNSFVLPGLVDSHVHLTDEQGPDSRINTFLKTSADRAVDGAGYALKTVKAGFTTVADLGGDAEAVLALRNGIARGTIPGPRIIASAGAISVHGGHGDANGMPRQMAEVLRSPAVCSGADDCARAVRERVRDGADIIKITATGGVLSNTAAGVSQQLTDPELAAIVQAAHMMGRRVTAHAHGTDGINAALRAGVDSIEHGTYLDRESVRLLRQGNRYLVPTMMAGWWVGQLAEQGGVLTPAQADKARRVGPDLVRMVRMAHAAGVRIAFGTDTGVSPHGMNAREFQLLVDAGYTPLQSIQAATVNAADHLQLNNVAGRIAPGYAADIIAVDGDPLTDVATLMNVPFVMARGTTYKND